MAKKKSAPRKKSPVNKVFWSVDAFSRDQNVSLQVARAVKAFFGPESFETRPTYVLDFIAGSEDSRVTSKLHKAWKSQFVPQAEAALKEVVAKSGLGDPGNARVVVHGSKSKRQSALEVLKLAKKEGAQLIALATHGRRGVARFMLGSFAESLVTSSSLPVLSVNPSTHVSGEIRKILFPTDFSSASSKGFDVVLKKAKALKAELILFHKHTSPVEPVLQAGVYMLGGGWVPTAQFIETEEKSKKEISEKWIKKAAAAGVSARLVTGHPDLAISSSVCETAKEQSVDLIAMVNQTGRWASLILGSVSREVLRDANVPVWIMHIKS